MKAEDILHNIESRWMVETMGEFAKSPFPGEGLQTTRRRIQLEEIDRAIKQARDEALETCITKLKVYSCSCSTILGELKKMEEDQR